MAMLTCPSCKKIVSDISGKCPNCGAAMKPGASVKNNTPGTKLKRVSTIIMYVSSLLLFLDIFNITKTYVGGLLLGFGFTLQGFAQAKIDKEEGGEGKSKAKITIGIGIFFCIVGLVFLYLDLTLLR